MRTHTSEKEYECNFVGCGKTYTTSALLASHQKIHSGSVHKCQFKDCTFSTIYTNHLKKHQQSRHSNDRPFVCTVDGCVKRFKIKERLRAHIKIWHSNETPEVCPIDGCGKLVKPRLMKNHIDMHSKEFLFCDYPECGFKSKISGVLNYHKKNTHSSERNYVCDWTECGKRFKTKTTLTSHMKTHTNVRLHVCEWPGCPFRTTLKIKLTEHIITHTNEKPFACSWPGCEYRCSNKGNMSVHMKVHTNTKPFACDWEGSQ